MTTDEPQSTAAGLLRVAGFPVKLWTSAGNPKLFDDLRQLIDQETTYAAFAENLAERLGLEVVPHPDLDKPERAALLALRRKLHAASDLSKEQGTILVNRLAELKPELAEDLDKAFTWSTELQQQGKALAAAVDNEQARLAGLSWQLVNSSPLAVQAITESTPDLLPEIERRLADRESWDGKRLRHRADYLLRLLARGSVKTIPRGWFAHVGLVNITPSARTIQIGAYARKWTANIQSDRQELTKNFDASKAIVTITGLHWTDDERLHCWVVDPDDLTTLRRVVVRRTTALDAIRQTLVPGACRADHLIASLLPAEASEAQRETLRGFVQHLVGLGIVQVSAPSRSHTTSWTQLPTELGSPEPGYTDAYRQVSGAISEEMVSHLTISIQQAGRLKSLLSAEPIDDRDSITELVGAEPRPVTEILAEFLQKTKEDNNPADTEQTRTAKYTSSWTGLSADSPLRTWLETQADSGTDAIAITPEILDELGARSALEPQWPMDCLIRPLLKQNGQEAVLKGAFPAGVIDSRFAEALSHLHGEFPQVDKYRNFLAKLEQQCQVRCVEILVPPLADQAANAVRRPNYTSLWTGDADFASYRPAGEQDRYLPLDHMTIRRAGNQFIAEDLDGNTLWPMYHATRSTVAPWKFMTRLLLSASPVWQLAQSVTLRNPLAAFPHRAHLPRLVLGNLVLSPAQWSLTREQLPAASLSLPLRAKALAALRGDRHIPRWAFAYTPYSKPRPLDLDSLNTLRLLDKLFADSTLNMLILEEMLPDPDHLVVHDANGDAFAAELLIRLPYGEELVDRAATALEQRG